MKPDTNNIWVVVPAAGSGKRMLQGLNQKSTVLSAEKRLPKQYLSVLGKPIIAHTLERLLQIQSLSAVVVALAQDDIYFDSLSIASKVLTVEGGQERCDSVLSALHYLRDKAKPSDWVLVHDAARCCVRVDVIDAMLNALADHPVGGILAVPASDTLKQVDQYGDIQQTLNREYIWQAQTPQVFRYDLLLQALEQSLKNEYLVTDEASAIEQAGYQAKVILGHYDNIKVTHSQDLLHAEVILQQQVFE